METATVYFPVEESIAIKIKNYAQKQKTSMADMIENYFTILAASSKTEKKEISPLVRSFSIDGIKAPSDFDYKKEIAKYRDIKFL